MKLVVHPPEGGGKEADDKFMLEEAEKYGAIIFSNDKFTNHLDHRSAALRYRIGYERRKKRIDYNNLSNIFPIGCTYVINAEKSDFAIIHHF